MAGVIGHLARAQREPGALQMESDDPAVGHHPCNAASSRNHANFVVISTMTIFG